MTKILFLVHGIGSNPSGWSASIRDKLDEVAGQYSAFKKGSAFSQRVQLVEIQYDGIFDQFVDQWKAQADALDAWSKTQSMPLPKVVSWLKRTLPNGDDAKNFFWSTALDAILYRGFALVRDQIRAAVISQFVNGLTTNMTAGAVQASVLAHSLGTAVTHDALSILGGGAFQGNQSFTAGRFAFDAIFMLADVCQLGPANLLDIDPLTSVVRPTSAGTAANTYCQSFLNARHRFDPIVLPSPFEPGTWGNGYFAVGPLQHFHSANVHGFTHYLDHPSVHIPIINGTLGVGAISLQEEQDAVATYPVVVSNACDDDIQRLKATAESFKTVGADLEELVIKISEFYALAKQVATSCKELANV